MKSFPKTVSMLLAGAALAFLPSMQAQQDKPWEKIPTPPLHAFKPHQPVRVALKNGIVLFLQEDHELPFVHGSITIPGGSRDVEPAKAGLADIYGLAWRTSGTEKVSGDALDDLLEAKAAHIETGTDDDGSSLAWDSLKADADSVFALAFDLFLHPQFKADKLELAQQMMATNIVRRNDDEGQIAGREAAKLVYGADSPYTRQPELSTIGAVTLADLEAFHARTITAPIIVSVSGDFDAAAMEAKLRAAFEALPPAKKPALRHDAFPGPKPGVWFVNKDDVNQSEVLIVGLGTDRHNPDIPAIAVMNEILGGGFASRLFQKVRTEMGLAYAVGGGLNFGWDHPAPLQVMVRTKSDKTVEATQAALTEIASLTARPVTDEEVKRAKETILNSFLFRYDTRDKVLAARVRLEYYGYPANYLETYQAALEKVTPADVNAVAKKYIHPEKLAVLVVGKEAELQTPLTELKLGEVHKLDVTIPMPKQ